ncbi:MAG: hypothetical protein R3B40_15715 [Polyangiales bacterium]
MSARRPSIGRWAALLTCALLQAGCWPEPPRGWYDAGPDAPGCGDGGCCAPLCCGDAACDAGEPDMGTTSRERERACTDGMDNDRDGRVDCDDSDCTDQPACCADGAPLFSESWGPGALEFKWRHLPSTMPTASPARDTSEGILLGWPDSVPHALLWHRCVPLALGAEVTFDAISVKRTGACRPFYEPCNEHAAVVLSPVGDTELGSPLLEDLAIRVHGDSRVALTTGETVFNQAMLRVTQAGQELGRVDLEPDVRYRVRLSVTPSTYQGAPSLRGDIEVSLASDPEHVPLHTLRELHIGLQAALERQATGCQEVGGLFVGVEMVGDEGGRLGPLATRMLSCANPSQFDDEPDGTATLTPESLGVPASYGGAYLGAPTLGSSFNSAQDTSPRWDLFFEATNEPPELETAADVGYAVGHANTASFGSMLGDWTTSSAPRLGSDPPSCLLTPGPCAGPSVREPFLLVKLGTDDALSGMTLAFARRSATGGHELRIQDDVALSPNAPLGGTEVRPALTATECVDLRDPALVPVGDGSGYWLFFTCVRGFPQLSDLRAARLNADYSARAEEALVVLSSSDVGALAEGGLSGPEPMVHHTAAGTSLLLWFIARDLTGRTTLALAMGQLPSPSDADEGDPAPTPLTTLPSLVPYVANPLLRGDEPVLGGCAGLCVIAGVAVSATAGDSDELRFLVARRVVPPDGSAHDELVPLTQTWRAP